MKLRCVYLLLRLLRAKFRLRFCLLAAFALLPLLTGKAIAAEGCRDFSAIEGYIGSASVDGEFQIIIVGGFGQLGGSGGAFSSIIKAYQGENKVHVLLNTPGGVYADAVELIDQINIWKNKGANIEIEVPPRGAAESTGTLILAAASHVILDSTSQIGFHGAGSLGNDLRFHIDEAGTNLYLNKLTELGISPAWIKDMKNRGLFSTREMTCLLPSQLGFSNFLK